jgi:rhamnogalacturonan endolyase
MTNPGTSPERLPLGRREFLTRAGVGGLAIGIGAVAVGELAPAASAASFGYTSSGGYYTVTTGAGLVFKIRQSNGDMTSLNYNGTELQDQHSFSQVESGLGAMPRSVS